MKRFLPLLAMSAMFIAAPAFAQDADTEVVAQAPSSSTAVVVGQRPRMNFSDAQLEQLRSIRTAAYQATVTKKADLAVVKSKLRTALTATNVDRNAVMALQSQANAIQADINNVRLSAMLDAGNVFTPEQKQQMHARMLHGGFGRHHGGWGKGKGGCGGGRGHHGGGHGFGGHRGFGGPGGPGPGAHAMEDAPAPEMTADEPDAPDFDGLTASLPPVDAPDFDDAE